MEGGEQHHTPHFHAYYQEAVAVYGIDPIELLSGELPKRPARMVKAWAELHQEALREAGGCCRLDNYRGQSHLCNNETSDL